MADLDTRVAVLMEPIHNAIQKSYNAGYADSHTQGNGRNLSYIASNLLRDAEQAIRAELQKPALHEPCTQVEAARVMAHLHYQGNPDVTMKSVRFAVNSVLQGRAKSAQEEITDAERYLWIRELPNADSLNVRFCGSDLDNVVDAAIRASKGEK